MFSAVARRLSGGAKEMAADLVRAMLTLFVLLVLLHLTPDMFGHSCCCCLADA
jgi:hypothetical protein